MENDNNIGFENQNQQQNDQPQYEAQEQQNSQPQYEAQQNVQPQDGAEAQQNAYGQNNFDRQQNAYGQNNFNGQQNAYSQNNFNGQQNMYGQNAYGMPPVDKKGKPMQNRFGMKLTFSILEILTLFSCNLLTGILGIISCVFTAKANTAYKESRWDDFKSAAKTSAICLWVGFAGFIVEFIVWIVLIVVVGFSAASFIGSDATELYNDSNYDYEYDYDSDYNYDDEEDSEDSEETETTLSVTPSNVTAGSGITDTTITLNGATFTLPVSYSDFKAAGFSISSDDEVYVLNPGYYSSTITLYDANGNDIGYCAIYDNTDAPAALSECMVYGVTLHFADYYDAVGDIVLPNGVTAASTKDEVMTAYGEPDDSYESDDAEYDSQDYTWYYHNDAYYDDYNNSLQISYWDGVIDEIDIRYIGWDE